MPGNVETVSSVDTPPLVSVIIPTKNRPDMLIDAIRSVLGQTYRHFEILVINDGGGDVEGILSNLDADGRIVYVRLPQSRERSFGRNLGVQLAQGKYITYLDDDDRYYPQHLETLVEFLERTGHQVAYADAYRVHQTKEHGRYVTKSKDLPYSQDFNADQILVNNFIPNLCLMHAKACVEQVGGFESSLEPHEDWDFLIRLSQQYSIHHIQTVTAEFSWRTDGSTSTSARQPDFLRTRELIYEKYQAVSRAKPRVWQAQQHMLGKGDGGPCPFECSIIIPVFNKADLTQQCITQLAQITEGVTYEVIVVDNASTDETSTFLSTLGGDVQIIRNDKNLGFAKACNQGAEIAKGRNLVFLNNDTIPQSGWLHALVSEVNSSSEVKIVGSKLLFPDNTIQHAGVVFSRKYVLPYHWARGLPGDSLLVNQRRYFKAVTGACMLVDREAFEKVGGFDEGYVNGYEDVDLCLKIGEQGGRVVYQPRSCLYHLESQTPGRQDHMKQNGVRFLGRWENMWLEDEDIAAYENGCAIVQHPESQTNPRQVVPMENEKERDRWHRVVVVEQVLAGLPKGVLENPELGERLQHILGAYDEWPNDPGALEWGGYVCEQLGYGQPGQGFWNRLLKSGEHPAARLGLARSAIKGGNLHEAQTHLDVLKQTFSFSAEAATLQGVLFFQRQQFREAKLAFKDGLDQDPTHKKARLGFGMAMLGQGEAAEAFEVFQSMLNDHPDDQEVIHWVVIAGTTIKDWVRIADQLEKFLMRNPASCDIRFTLAGVYLRGGMKEKSQREYETLRMVNPDYAGLDDLASHLSVSSPFDPGYSKNEEGNHANLIDSPFHQHQPASTAQKKRISVLVADVICAQVRLVKPLLACIERIGVQAKVFSRLENEERQISVPTGPEEVWLTHRTDVIEAESLKTARARGTRIVHDIDDLVWNVPDDNPNIVYERIRSPNLKKFLPFVDCVTVSTEPIQESLSKWGIESVVLPNCLIPHDWMGLTPQRRVGHLPRVGWAGQTGVHKADLALLNSIMEELDGEVEWVFLGDAPELIGNSRIGTQVSPMVTIQDFPQALANLNLDVALAPLAYNEFNEAKSDIRILQYGILGYPVIATDIYPHRQAPIGRVPNNPAAWVRAIRDRIHNLDTAESEGEKLRQWVLANRMIDQWLPYYQAVWLGLPWPTQKTDSPIRVESKKNMTTENVKERSHGSIDCSIIIPVFNRCDLTRECLTALADVTQGCTYEVIVINNGSDDDTPNFLRSLGDKIKVIHNEDNLGFSKACNQGARMAKGRYLVFLNNDTLPKVGWLSPLVDELRRHPDVAVVGSKLLYPSGKIQHAGVVVSRRDCLPYLVYRNSSGDEPFVNRRRDLSAVSAACMAVREDVFNQFGGFDEGFRNGFEDVDLCLRVKAGGYRVIYQPNSVLTHYESQTESRKDYDHDNSDRFLKKWRDVIIEDEDSFYLEDGFCLSIQGDNGKIHRDVRPINQLADRNGWEIVAKIQQQGWLEKVEGHRALFVEVTKWPQQIDVLCWAADLCRRMHMNQEAQAFWKHILSIAEHADARKGLATIALEQGDLAQADSHLRVLVNADPNNGESHLLVGILSMQHHDFSKAAHSFVKALECGVDMRKARMGEGMATMGMGDCARAWQLFSAMCLDDPDDKEVLHWLLRAGTNLSKWNELQTILSQFLDRHPDECEIRYALAGVQLRLGNSQEAQLQLEAIHRLKPDFQGLETLAEAIQRSQTAVKSLNVA